MIKKIKKKKRTKIKKNNIKNFDWMVELKTIKNYKKIKGKNQESKEKH
jgi:hypothetical protein